MLIGHETNIRILKELLTKQQGGMSLLFWGPEQTGKKTIAVSFIKGLLCERGAWGGCIEAGAKQPCAACAKLETSGISADFLFVNQGLREVVKDAEGIDMYDTKGARRCIAFLDAKPLVGRFRVLLIDDAHLLDVEAQNVLLKTMEEPFGHAIVILVTHKPMALLDTVRSRLMQLNFGLVADADIEKFIAAFPGDEKMKQKALRYCFMRPGMAYDLLTREKGMQEFESRIKAMLSLERAHGATPGQKISVAAGIREQNAMEPDAWFALWQAVVRDQILMDLELPEYAHILTKRHGTAALAEHVALARKLVEAERWADISQSTFKSALEYVAMKI